jgi:ATP-binding cassette subfamily C protein
MNMPGRIMRVNQSQYLSLTCGEEKMFTVKSGSLEVYACTPEGGVAYHKVFLAALTPGESFFSPSDCGAPLEFSVFAISDAEINSAEISSVEAGTFALNASEWFRKIAELPWVRDLTGADDENTSGWHGKSAFADDTLSLKEFGSEFIECNKALSTHITSRFSAIDEKARLKRQKRAAQKGKTLLGALSSLLKTEYQWMANAADSVEIMDDPVRFSVVSAARHLGMDTENISIPNDIVAKMDAVTKMRRFIKKANMQVRLVALQNDWHTSDSGVMLCYYGEEREPAALLPEGAGKYRLVSASFPHGVTVDRDVAQKIEHEAFVCYPGLPLRKLMLSDMLRFMMRHSPKPDWRAVWIVSLVSGVLSLLLPLITESIFSDIIPINDRQGLGTVTQVMLVSGLTTAILGFVRSISALRLKSHAGIALESALWSRLLSLPTRFFRQYDAGDLIGRMQGISAIKALLDDNVLSVMFNTLFSFWSLCLMLYYSPRLTITAAAVWVVYIAVISFFYRKLTIFSRKKVDASNKVSARTLQILGGLSKFKLAGGEDAAFHLWSRTFGEAWSWNLKMRWNQNFSGLINSIQPTVLTMIVYYVTMSAVDGGKQTLSYSAFMGFQAAFSGFNMTLVSFIPIVASVYNVIPFIENIKPILEAEPEVTGDKLDVGALSGEIEVKNLHFSYDPDSPMVLRGISLKIKAGESVAFVGASGCGKSTLIRILLGFEKPSQGAVLFDGQDFSSLNVSSVRSQMGVVIQNGQLMSGEILTNIVGTSPLTLDDAWDAARLVGLDSDIENMPMGMNTFISEGAGNISGGQKQRILIARSIVNKPKIIILDEATSALDNTTQAIVSESMKRLSATRITVAHRLSTIKDADRIYVLDEGRIAEEGSYEELMRKGGIFARLARRQLE